MSLSRRAVIAGAAALPFAARAAPRSELLDPRWTRSGDRGDPDAAPWARFLERHRSVGAAGIALVDYAGAPRDALKSWLAAYAATDPATLRPKAQFAFWCNLYNALTVDLVLQAWPVDSIKQVRGGLFNTGPWDERVVTVAGAELSLDDIEHGILRPVHGDPRVHYAVNCAALGCPNLLAEPFAEATLDETLEGAAARYVNHPRGARIEGGRLIVSSIYEWFQEDFGGSDAGVLAHLRRYATGGTAAALEGRTRVDDDAYDWSINAA
ncbi:MAG: DUF547 domain-containing protein [Paracoccaceae bacterium]